MLGSLYYLWSGYVLHGFPTFFLLIKIASFSSNLYDFNHTIAKSSFSISKIIFFILKARKKLKNNFTRIQIRRKKMFQIRPKITVLILNINSENLFWFLDWWFVNRFVAWNNDCILLISNKLKIMKMSFTSQKRFSIWKIGFMSFASAFSKTVSKKFSMRTTNRYYQDSFLAPNQVLIQLFRDVYKYAWHFFQTE